jgi:hypothetical protein
MGGSVGGSKSDSKASTSQDVWGPQGDALKKLYDQAGGLFEGMDFSKLNDMAANLDPYNQNIMTGAQGGFNDMMGGGSYGDTSQIRDKLMSSLDSTSGGSQMGKMYNSIVGGQGNTYIDPMVDAMKRSGMENLDAMHARTGMDASAMGQGGSSRHAMQNAMQTRDMNKDMLDRETMMRGGAYDTDLAMKMDIARQADSGIQGTQDRYMRMLSGADQNKQTGMNFGSLLQNLGMGSMAPWMQAQNAPWQAMGNYANTIGAPTVLGSGSQSGSSKGANAGASMKG